MRFGVPARLAYDVEEPLDDAAPTVYLMHLPDGPSLVLTGMGAWLWLLAVEGEPEVVRVVAWATGEDVDVVGPEIRSFLENLVSDGLLLRPEPSQLD